MALLRFLKRVLLTVIVVAIVVFVVGIGWVLTHRDDARAWRQVSTIAAGLVDLGGTSEAAGEWLAVDTTAAREVAAGTLPATLVRPDDDDAADPAIVLLVPEGTTGAEEQRVREAQHAIAGAGLSAWAVRVPGGADALVDAAGYEALAGSLAAIASHDTTEDERVSVVAAGPIASLVLVAAASDDLREQIRAVVAVQPIADVRGIVSLATTGSYVRADGRAVRVELSPELRESAGRAVFQAIRADLPDGGPVLEPLLDAAEASDDPLAALELVPPDVAGPELRPLLDVARAETPAEFDAAWDRLPSSFRDAAGERSPLPFAGQVQARVLAVQASEEAWAQEDVARLADALPDARTLELDPEDPGSVVDDPAAVRDLLSVSGWWMRRAGSS